MRDRLDHAARRLSIHALNSLVQPRKSQALHHGLVFRRRRVLRAVVLNANHLCRRHYSSSTVLPRIVAAPARSRTGVRASKVALITLCGFGEPMLLVSTFCTPTEVITARTAPPAITPVPSGAGFNSPWPEPKR